MQLKPRPRAAFSSGIRGLHHALRGARRRPGTHGNNPTRAAPSNSKDATSPIPHGGIRTQPQLHPILRGAISCHLLSRHILCLLRHLRPLQIP